MAYFSLIALLLCSIALRTHGQPQQCLGEQIYVQCKTCSPPCGAQCIPPVRCFPGCECPPEKPHPLSNRYGLGRCVAAHNCPTCSVDRCLNKCGIMTVPKPGTECGSCTCEDPCKYQNCTQGQFCKVLPTPCAAPGPCPVYTVCESCPNNQMWNEAANACIRTCEKPNYFCRAPAVARCDCPPQTPILHNDVCIAVADCPKVCPIQSVQTCQTMCAQSGSVPVASAECNGCTCESCQTKTCPTGTVCQPHRPLQNCLISSCPLVPQCRKLCSDGSEPLMANNRAFFCDASSPNVCTGVTACDVSIRGCCPKTNACDTDTRNMCNKKCADKNMVPVKGKECQRDCPCIGPCKTRTCQAGFICQPIKSCDNGGKCRVDSICKRKCQDGGFPMLRNGLAFSCDTDRQCPRGFYCNPLLKSCCFRQVNSGHAVIPYWLFTSMMVLLLWSF